MLDVIIIGGGAAGLSAALILGRFNRHVLVYDHGKKRNANSRAVHGMLSRDGISPKELIEASLSQLKQYPSIHFRQQEVLNITKNVQSFTVTLADGSVEHSRRILFATGVKDELPQIEGLEHLWGTSVFHCPYCHGWEAQNKAVAILANGQVAVHLSKLLLALTQDLVICTQEPSEISEQDTERLTKWGVSIITTPILKLESSNNELQRIVFQDGTQIDREAIFVHSRQTQHSPLPQALGCRLTDAGHLEVDSQGRTSVAGIYAAGDLIGTYQQVIFAAAQGATAAATINTEIAEEVFMR
jgi:thioredoxin reductase